MSFDRSNWNSISRMTTAPKPVWLTYVSTDDALATIAASGYFNEIANEIDANDIIYVVGSDGTGLYRFTSANGVSPVTVSTFDPVPAGSIGTADLASGAVTLAKLASGVAPSHVVKYAGQHTTAGGSASEAITVTGVAATDLVFAQMKTQGATPRTILAAVPTTNTVTITFSGDPSTDHVIYYQVLRAAA